VELLHVLLFILVKFNLESLEEIIDTMIAMRLLSFGVLLSSLGYAPLSISLIITNYFKQKSVNHLISFELPSVILVVVMEI
jgi:hypothetical protein